MLPASLGDLQFCGRGHQIMVEACHQHAVLVHRDDRHAMRGFIIDARHVLCFAHRICEQAATRYDDDLAIAVLREHIKPVLEFG